MDILVVDDSSTMRRILINGINSLGKFNIKQAGNGEEGLELCKKGKFDLILTDQNMPLMTGIEMVEEIRRIDDDVYIIMITTESDKSSVIKALKAGINSYIIKPFTSQGLKEKISPILNI